MPAAIIIRRTQGPAWRGAPASRAYNTMLGKDTAAVAEILKQPGY